MLDTERDQSKRKRSLRLPAACHRRDIAAGLHSDRIISEPSSFMEDWASARHRGASTVARVALRNITKQFGPVQMFQVLDLDVANGELSCLLDPSGSGKTTLRRIIAGREGLDGGEIWVGCREISALWCALSEIALVLAHPAVLAVGLLAFIFSWTGSSSRHSGLAPK